MTPEKVFGFEYDEQSDEMIYITGTNALPIRYLSAGYQSLIWMIFDIAFRMALQKTFPNVQFIAATHSPIIIASCKNVNLMRINEDKQIIYSKSPYGMDVNDTLDICQDRSLKKCR